MTDPNSNGQNSPEKQSVERRLEVLERRLEAHSKQFDGLHEELKEERDRRRQLEEELEEEKERTQGLRDEIAQLDSRTDLLELVQTTDEMDSRQRATVLIQHLHRAAQKQRNRGMPAKSSVNRNEADRALQYPDVDRTTIYRDMERAADLVGDESVLWYEGGSDSEARLKLDLEAGDVPMKFTEGE